MLWSETGAKYWIYSKLYYLSQLSSLDSVSEWIPYPIQTEYILCILDFIDHFMYCGVWPNYIH